MEGDIYQQWTKWQVDEEVLLQNSNNNKKYEEILEIEMQFAFELQIVIFISIDIYLWGCMWERHF